ncbi:MAG: ImmA/IrrE family metallo-endopeptidase [Chloroflexi bacterium]|nr:ImmA/IrrE family metallo-endopeptidase [Chloroflexota bacterium]OJV88695.1 MAG: hypothetical protein BGO39_04100 [Chloroflexi bacterium 54-19]
MINPSRIKQARVLGRLTQAQLAESVGLQQSMIAHIEGGRYEPSEETLHAIAKVLNFPVSFFHRLGPPNFPSGSLLFRAHATQAAADKDHAYEFGRLEYESVLLLAKKVRVKPAYKLPQLTGEYLEGEVSVREAAEQTRSALGLSLDQPIRSLVRLIEQSGVVILALPTGSSKCDAFSQWASIDENKNTSSTKRAFIALASEVPGDRLRFTLAHEIGHLVLHQSVPIGSTKIEDEAHKFAAEFLMPAEVMRQQITTPIKLKDLLILKSIWGVSVAALIHRAHDLGIINDRQNSYLNAQLNIEGWKKNEPNPIPVEKPRAIRQMAEAIYGNPINYQKLAQDLDLPPIFVKRFLDGYATKNEYLQKGKNEVTEDLSGSNITPFRPRISSKDISSEEVM